MSNPEHPSESDPGQPKQEDRPYNLLCHRTRSIAELIALGDVNDPSIFDAITGDGSTLPPGLREMVQKWLRDQEQTNNSTSPPPNTPQ